MSKSFQGESYVPSQTKPVDWMTVEILQNKRRRTKNEFYIDSIEYALERVLESPNRIAVGEQLAKDLFRDGKRVIASVNGLTGRNAINRLTYEYLEPKFDHQTEMKDGSMLLAVSIVKTAFNALEQREALALYICTTGINTTDNIYQILGVTVRQYRNLLNQARLKLKTYTGFKEAYFLLYINSEEADLKDFFTQLINGMFNYQLS